MSNPLATLPDDISPTFRARVEKLAQRPGKAPRIALKCFECCAWQPQEVTLCMVTDCALWDHRPGRGRKVTS